jgi:uncharacterized protein (DUF983 family)
MSELRNRAAVHEIRHGLRILQRCRAGGYELGDYRRLGLPIELIIVAVGVPLLGLFWLF